MAKSVPGKRQAKRVPKTTRAADTLAAVPDAPVRKLPPNNLPRDADGKVIAGPKHNVTDPKAALNPRQAILTAFGDVGGVRWLKKLARRYPKDFASLLAKVMPQELSVTGTIGYMPMAIPVEERDAIPGEFTVIEAAPPIPALPGPEEPDPFT